MHIVSETAPALCVLAITTLYKLNLISNFIDLPLMMAVLQVWGRAISLGKLTNFGQ